LAADIPEDEIVVTADRCPPGRICRYEDIAAVMTMLAQADTGGAPRDGGGGAGNGGETPETEQANEEDLEICRSLSDPGARSRCYQSALARDVARKNGRPVPPLVTWRQNAPAQGPNPWVVGGVVIGGVLIVGAIILAPEITIPALILSGGAVGATQ
jgi:hypothetical protein